MLRLYCCFCSSSTTLLWRAYPWMRQETMSPHVRTMASCMWADCIRVMTTSTLVSIALWR